MIPLALGVLLAVTGADSALASQLVPASTGTVVVIAKQASGDNRFDYYYTDFDRVSPLVACKGSEALLIVNGGLSILNADKLSLDPVSGGAGFHWRQFWGVAVEGDIVRIGEHFEDSEKESPPSEYFEVSFSSRSLKRVQAGPGANNERIIECGLSRGRLLTVTESGIRIRRRPSKSLHDLDVRCNSEWRLKKGRSPECLARSKDDDVQAEIKRLVQWEWKQIAPWPQSEVELAWWKKYIAGQARTADAPWDAVNRLIETYGRMDARFSEPNDKEHLYSEEVHSAFLAFVANEPSLSRFNPKEVKQLLQDLRAEQAKPKSMWGKRRCE